MQRPAFATQVKTGLTKLLVLCLGAVVLCGMVSAQTAGTYQVTNIVSDGSVPATTTDSAVINPWAISASPTWWISTEGSGFSYVVPVAGTIAFKVAVPAASTGAGKPTGDVTIQTTMSTALFQPHLPEARATALTTPCFVSQMAMRWRTRPVVILQRQQP